MQHLNDLLRANEPALSAIFRIAVLALFLFCAHKLERIRIEIPYVELNSLRSNVQNIAQNVEQIGERVKSFDRSTYAPPPPLPLPLQIFPPR